MTVVSTKRLELSPLTPADLDRFIELSDAPQVAASLSFMPHPLSRKDAEHLVTEGVKGGGPLLKIVLRGDGRTIGFAGLHPDEEGGAEIGYWIGTAYWRRGYAREAATALYEQAIAQGLRPWATCLPSNTASIRILTGLGLRPVGHRTSHYRVDNSTRELLVFAEPPPDED